MAERTAAGLISSCDCLIIGGGPAGLTGAIYLGRFRRKVVVIDAGKSRASWIPVSHNCPGFPDGIAGLDILDRLRQQALCAGVDIVADTVRGIRREGHDFIASAAFPIQARAVLMATGIVDRLPETPKAEEMIQAGTLRLCPICDAYEVIDKRVAVIGPLEDAMKKALFLRTYTSDVTALVTDFSNTPDVRRPDPGRRGSIKVAACVPDSIRPQGTQARIQLVDGTMSTFDTIYPAMGCTIQSMLAAELGAECDGAGNLMVDSHQRTAVPGLYAAGDVVDEINQIAVAFGHAAIAGTDIHNWLDESQA